MAQKVGASLWHMNNYAPSLGIRVPEYEAGFPITFAPGPGASPAGGYIYVGLDGRRFANETLRTGHGHGLVNGQYELFPRKPMVVVFDDRIHRAGPLTPPIATWAHGWNQLVEGYRWSDDNSAELERSWYTTAGSVRDLADRIGINATVLVETIDRWNAACRAGEDQFGREGSSLIPIDRPPYFAFGCGPNLLYTCGGPRKNEHAQVLDAFGAVIEGLYCAGELSSTYSRCMDGGMMIGDALAFELESLGCHSAGEAANSS